VLYLKRRILNLIKFVVFSLNLILLAGCASMGTPSSSLVDTKPVVTIGETKDFADDHIIFIPAGIKFPIEFSVKVTVFDEAVLSTVMVSFKNEMYLYKYWANLDGKTWVRSHKLVSQDGNKISHAGCNRHFLCLPCATRFL